MLSHLKVLLENRDIVIGARSDTAEIVNTVGSNRNCLALVINISTARTTADNDSPSQTRDVQVESMVSRG